MRVFDSSYDGLGDGLIDSADQYTVGESVIADCTGFGHVLEKFRDEGVRTFGGGMYADALEADRSLSEEVMRKAGIETPESMSIKTWDEARKAISRMAGDSEKVVLKPEGSLSGLVPSYVASDEEDALVMLKQFEKKFGAGEIELTVQEFIEGVAVSTEGWFNGSEWIEGMFNHTLEKKSFLAGDIGPSTGCTGNLVWACDSKDPIVKQTLTKLTNTLRKHRYIGPIDINCVVNKKGVYGLEFTPRFGYDAFPTTLHTLCDFDFGYFIDSLSRGGSPDVTLREGFGAGVRIGLPPWPSEKFKGEAGTPIRGFEEEDREWFYPYEVQLVDDELVSSKGYGILGVVNGHGQAISEAFARAYRIVKGLKVPDLQYRVDLVEAHLKDYRELLKALGDESEGWYGVDLDGTLASHSSWSDDIGEPIPRMVQRVKRWLYEGKEVRILTARGTVPDGRFEQLIKIHEWVHEHIGAPLEVTHEKDPFMIRLYDDRVVRVVANEGVSV
jgi:phosphoribosylamine--glycine ligase